MTRLGSFSSLNFVHLKPARHTGIILIALSLLLGFTARGATVTGVVTATHPEDYRVTLVTAEGERSFLVGRGDRLILKEGDTVSGKVVRQGDAWRLESIFPADPEQTAVIQRLGNQLQRDTLRRGKKVFRAVGERIPRFALWDQRGELFLSDSLRGNYAVINFVFTRCAMQEMCPAATRRMVELSRALDRREWEDVKLVSITLDPDYDTPGIWAAYAEDMGVDSARHYLLGGPDETVENLKQQLGVLAEPDATQIVRHTMSTALIDPSGKIIYRIPGSHWDPEVFLNQIEKNRTTP